MKSAKITQYRGVYERLKRLKKTVKNRYTIQELTLAINELEAILDKEVPIKYISKMKDAVDNIDTEVGHRDCDDVLCELLIELGYNDVVDVYHTQEKYF